MASRYIRLQPFFSSSRVAAAVTVILIMWLQSSRRLLLGRGNNNSATCLVRAFQHSIQQRHHHHSFTQSRRTWYDPTRRRPISTLFRRNFGLQKSSTADNNADGVYQTNPQSQNQFIFYIDTPDDMQDLGGLLAMLMSPPTALLLDGDLGAGKTALCRGFLRTITANPELVVTSPTYLLSNVYRSAAAAVATDTAVYHMDLYRLAQKETSAQVRDLLRPLNLDHVFAHDVVLMEWPERLGPAFAKRHDCHNATTTSSLWPVLPPERLEIDIRILTTTSQRVVDNDDDDDDEMQDVQRRVVTLTPVGNKWRQALQQAVEEGYVDDFLFPDDDDDDDE